MKILKYLIFMGVLAMASCKENKIGPHGTSDGAPNMVSNPVVENLPGAAKITYSLPTNPELLYIKAVYKLGDQVQEIKSSFYTNFLILQGFGNTDEREIKLYAVNRHEEMSAPLTVTIKPLEAPVKTVFSSISAKAVFGGMTLNFDNQSEAEVKINVITLDSLGDWQPEDILYTKKLSGDFSVRGFDPVKTKFGVFVEDRWNNRSDTLVTELTPLFEQQLEKVNFREYRLPTDAIVYPGWTVDKMWDNAYGEPGYHSVGSGIPQQVTLDLGVTALLSRFKYWQRNAFLYSANNPRIFEIWGSNDPNPDGSWDSWTKLMDCESIKPSGPGSITSEDRAHALAGEDFIFPEGVMPVRYIRFKTLKTWGASTDVHFMELTFWGQY
ncbi:MAG: DUF5000 domain-containing lipoprotein [Sphingobacteriaceae bacterium]